MDHDNPTKSIPIELKRCVERRVYSARKGMTKKQLDWMIPLDSCEFSAQTIFATNFVSDRLRKHNDSEDAYQFQLFEFAVLGSQITAEHDLVRITFQVGSIYMHLNAFRAIAAGWGFQLNSDVTGKCVAKALTLSSSA